jgi:hypothetical protein
LFFGSCPPRSAAAGCIASDFFAGRADFPFPELSGLRGGKSSELRFAVP